MPITYLKTNLVLTGFVHTTTTSLSIIPGGPNWLPLLVDLC